MAQNLIQSSPYKDEIDLKEVFKLILDSKKLFISTIIVFTLLSVVYSFSLKPEFKSSAILEIGHTELPDGTQKSIEKPTDLISNLNLYQFLNLQNYIHVTSYEVIEDKLIFINTTSKSAEQNENLLAEIIRDIDERHSNLVSLSKNQKKDRISHQIEMIESELSFTRVKELSKIEDRLAELNYELPIIDLEIRQLEKIILDDTNKLSLDYITEINTLNRKKSSYIQEIKSLNNQLQSLENDMPQSRQLFSLEQEKATLENELQVLMNQTQVKTRLIGNIETKTIKPKTLLIISLGIIIGFITSIFLVLISNFLKSFREVKA